MKAGERETPSGLRLAEVRLEPFDAALQLGARFCGAIVDHAAQGGCAAPVRDIRQDGERRWGSEGQSWKPRFLVEQCLKYGTGVQLKAARVTPDAR